MFALLRKRHADSHGPWVFPSTRGTLRDPDNTRKALREVVAGTEWHRLHPHAWEVADYLGHERVSMTQDVYMSSKSTGAGASAALDALDRKARGKRGVDLRWSTRSCG